MEEIKYSKEHEWIKKEGNYYKVGISDFAQDQLGDIVFVEVKTVGVELEKDKLFGTVEAVKTVSDLYMPVSGKVIEFNSKVEQGGDIINTSPLNEGWIIKVELKDPKELDALMNEEEYKKFISK